VEKTAATAIYPCKNLEAGCEDTFAVEDRNKHQLFVCTRANNVHLENCQLPTLPGLVLSDIAAHVRNDHSSEAIQDVGYLKMKLLVISREKRYLQAVFILVELCYLTWKNGSDAFSFAVFHFGCKNDVKGLKYRIKTGKSEENISVTLQCHSHLDGGLEKLQPGKCVTFHYGTIVERLGESGDVI
jgi:hypothetical protein